MTLQSASIIERISQGRCVRSSDLLTQEDTLIVSRKELPNLYSGKICPEERDYIRSLMRVLEPSKELTEFKLDCVASRRLEAFYLQLLSVYKTCDSFEAFLHQFLFRFWNRIDHSLAFGFPSDAQLYYKCVSPDSDNLSFLLGRLRRCGCQCDIAAYSKSDSVLWLIDAKRNTPDDRAIGQIKRYYLLATAVIEEEDPRKNIRHIRPALICPTVDVTFFYAMGSPFRDFCELWTYDVLESTVRIKDMRLILLSQIRNNRHISM
jgi:hypothetical protein